LLGPVAIEIEALIGGRDAPPPAKR
jgi:hypothetical protein